MTKQVRSTNDEGRAVWAFVLRTCFVIRHSSFGITPMPNPEPSAPTRFCVFVRISPAAVRCAACARVVATLDHPASVHAVCRSGADREVRVRELAQPRSGSPCCG
jgi:hypothetical protein